MSQSHPISPASFDRPMPWRGLLIVINNILFFLIVLTLYSCKSKTIGIYSHESNPYSTLMVSDSLMLIDFKGQFYSTGRLYQGRKSNTFWIFFDTIPFNEKVINVSYYYDKLLDSNKVNLEFKNVSDGFYYNINRKAIFLSNDSTISMEKSKVKDTMKFTFKFDRYISNPLFKYLQFYPDSNCLLLPLDSLQDSKYNAARIDCSNSYLFYNFKNGFEFFPLYNIIFATGKRRAKLTESSNSNIIVYVRDKSAPYQGDLEQIKNTKVHKYQHPQYYFIQKSLK